MYIIRVRIFTQRVITETIDVSSAPKSTYVLIRNTFRQISTCMTVRTLFYNLLFANRGKCASQPFVIRNPQITDVAVE